MLGAAALGSLGMGIYGAVSGAPASNVSLPSPLPGTGKAGKDFMATTGGLPQYNLFGQNMGLAENTSMGMYNNPFAGGFQAGAGPAGMMGEGAGLNMFGAGGNLYGAGTSAINMGMDPQNLLYARTAQQVQDQTRTGLEARGVDSTPYGAGIEGQTMSNFNIDWQNQQLQRALAGLQGGGQAYGQAGQMQAQAPIQYLQGAGMPYQTAMGIGQGQMGALGGLGQFGQQGAQIPEWMAGAYSGYATGAGGVNNQTGQLGLQQAQLGFNQNQQMGQGIGWGLGAMSNSRPMGWGASNNPFNAGPNFGPGMGW